MPLRAVLFDLDGTVVENAYDWPRIRAALGAGREPLLTWIEKLPEPERSAKRALLEKFETEQTERSVLRAGMGELLLDLAAHGLRTALITNNSLKNTVYLLGKFGLRFDQVLTRETGLWKPSGEPLIEAARRLDVPPEDCCVVGDTSFDVLAARAAGIPRVFLLDGGTTDERGPDVEVVRSAEELREKLLEMV